MYKTIVIGAGQAGLAMGYYLKQLDHSFLIIDKGENIGDTWRNRYDSLVLFTPRMYNSLPGLPMQGDPHTCPDKDEIARYLKRYADIFQLPVQLRTEVKRVWKEQGRFFIQTDSQVYEADHVITATGPFQSPSIPPFAQKLAPEIRQLHSSQYKNPADLADGNVLIVGAGNSGAQIAVELSNQKETYLSFSQRMKFLPLEIGSRSIFWWFDKAGLLKAPRHSWIAKKIRANGDPIFGLALKKALAAGKVVQKPRVTDGSHRTIQFQDQSTLHVQNIIWSTGFKMDYSWLDIDGVLNDEGRPVHQRGVTPITGFYFLGLLWQYRRGSALLQGVGADAEYLAAYIKNH